MWLLIALSTIPVIAVVAWVLSSHFPDLARRLTRCAIGFAAIVWGALVATGLIGQVGDARAMLHHWLGHLLIIVVWSTLPVSIGVFLQQGLKRQPWRTIGRVILALVTVYFCLTTTFTGHLAPLDPALDAETRLRFKIFHCIDLPSLTGLFLGLWLIALGRIVPKPRQEEADFARRSGIQTDSSATQMQ